MKNITHRHRRFVEEYCGDANFNGAEAARRAGYSESRARITASELLADPDIEQMVEERLEKLSMSAAEATKRLSDIARADISDFLTKRTVKPEYGEPYEQLVVDVDAVLERGGGVIQGIDGNGNPKLYDAQAALKTLLDAHGAFNHKQKHEHGGADGQPIQVTFASETPDPDDA